MNQTLETQISAVFVSLILILWTFEWHALQCHFIGPWLIFKRDAKSEKWAQFSFFPGGESDKGLGFVYDQTRSLHIDEWTQMV